MRLHERIDPQKDKRVVFSLGGSILYGERTFKRRLQAAIADIFRFEIIALNFDRKTVHGVIGMLRDLTERDFEAYVVTGGGILARLAMKDARDYSSENGGKPISQRQLDYIGKDASQFNASRLIGKLKSADVPVIYNSTKDWGKKRELQGGKVIVRGGTEPGHSTDMVAVDIAIAEKVPFVVNIGNTPGLYPRRDTKLGYDPKDAILEVFTISDYLNMYPGERMAGDNFIFEREAAQKALENDIAIILVGSNVENIDAMISGHDFKGTMLIPDSWAENFSVLSGVSGTV